MSTLSTSLLVAVLAAPGGIAAAEGDASRPGREIAWRPDFEAALEEAAQAGKPLLVDFEAAWCGFCKKLDRETYADERVARLVSEHFVPVKVDTDEHPELAEKYGVSGLPTILFLSPRGEEIQRLRGFLSAERFLAEAGKSARSAAALEELRAAARRDPADLAAQRAYARALLAAGSTAEAVEILRRAREESREDSGLLLDLADALRARGDPREARALYEELLALPSPAARADQRRAYLPLARLLIGAGEHRRAADRLGELLAGFPPPAAAPPPARREAAPEEAAGSPAAAGEPTAERIEQLEALFLRAYARSVLKDAEGSLADLRAASRLDPAGEWGLRASAIVDLLGEE